MNWNCFRCMQVNLCQSVELSLQLQCICVVWISGASVNLNLFPLRADRASSASGSKLSGRGEQQHHHRMVLLVQSRHFHLVCEDPLCVWPWLEGLFSPGQQCWGVSGQAVCRTGAVWPRRSQSRTCQTPSVQINDSGLGQVPLQDGPWSRQEGGPGVLTARHQWVNPRLSHVALGRVFDTRD